MAFIQDPPQLKNQYEDDRPLQAILRRRVPADALDAMQASLSTMGELSGGPMYERLLEARADEPRHVPFDSWGNRIDEVVVPDAWREYARIAAREGVVATAYERKHGEHSRLHQFALVYLYAPSSHTYSCPLAMTDGCARTLERIGTEALKQEVLSRLIDRDPERAWTSGQWMTEKSGGSDVGRSLTVAREVDGQWRLYGDKWFTSAVTSEVTLTLARPEGNPEGGKGLALYFLKLRNDDGSLNGIRVNRLKEKLGTRMLPTAELTLDGAVATPPAGQTDGIRNIATMLNLTRTWNAVCAAGGMRRGLALARDYATRRVAFGAPLSQKPLHHTTLARIAAEQEAALGLVFNVIALLGREECGELNDTEAALLRALTPITKLLTGRQAVATASEVLEAFGGAGYVEDTGLPMLLRDAQVLSIWEGTTNVLSLETFRSVQRTDALRPLVELVETSARKATAAELREPAEAAIAAAEHASAWWDGRGDRDPQVTEGAARDFAMTVGRAVALATLVEQAQWGLDHGDGPRSAHAARLYAGTNIDTITDEPALSPKAAAELAMG